MAIRYDILYSQTRKSQTETKRFERRHAMKQKVCKAMQVMIAVTMEDIGFFLISGLALVIILKLACA